jgi:hypothetical protein
MDWHLFSGCFQIFSVFSGGHTHMTFEHPIEGGFGVEA